MDGMLQKAGTPQRGRPGTARARIDPDLVAVAPSALLAWDFCSVAAAGVISAAAYRAIFPDRVLDITLHGSFGREVLLQACVCSLLLRLGGAGDLRLRALPRLLRHAAGLPVLLIAVGFATRSLHDLSRAWVLMWSVTTLGFVIAGRCALGQAVHVFARRGQLRLRVAVICAGPRADGLIRVLETAAPETVEVVGIYDDRRSRWDPNCRLPDGTIADLLARGRQEPLDWLVIALPPTAQARIAELLRMLKSHCAQIAICPADTGPAWLAGEAAVHEFLGGLPLRMLASRPLRRWRRLVKAIEDRVLGLLLVLLLSPLLLTIALAVRLDSPGPILFRQSRQGWNNGDFRILKFRTMVWQPVEDTALRQTARGDTRVTRLGRLLRATSLDELPQLFNVLRGEMSLVGPRPHALTMRTQDRAGEQIVAEYAHRHRVKPGMTGWAQIHGLRGPMHTAEQLRRRVEYDLYYIDHWSLLLDLQILLRTALLLLGDRHAY